MGALRSLIPYDATTNNVIEHMHREIKHNVPQRGGGRSTIRRLDHLIDFLAHEVPQYYASKVAHRIEAATAVARTDRGDEHLRVIAAMEKTALARYGLRAMSRATRSPGASSCPRCGARMSRRCVCDARARRGAVVHVSGARSCALQAPHPRAHDSSRR